MGRRDAPEELVNFLQLCQRASVECGAGASQDITVALPTVVGATGALGRIVGWVGDAFSDIQCDHDDWDWMLSSNILGAGISFATVAGRFTYPLGTGTGTVGVDPETFGKWKRGTFRNFTTTNSFRDEIMMADTPYDLWRDQYMFGAQRSVTTRPIAIAIGPDKSLNLGPPPTALYTVTGDYFMAPSTMVNDADLPVGLPTRFHMLIVYRAMMKYGAYEAATEVYQRGSEENAGMYAQLQARYAPEITWGGALA
jgi:hypothetical protein